MGPQITEITLPAAEGEGEGERVGLCFTTNAIVQLEKEMGCNVTDMGAKIKDGGFDTVRKLVRAGLEGWRKRCKPSRAEFTEDDAGNAFDELGGLHSGAGKLLGLFGASHKKTDIDAAVAAIEGEEPKPANPTK